MKMFLSNPIFLYQLVVACAWFVIGISTYLIIYRGYLGSSLKAKFCNNIKNINFIVLFLIIFFTFKSCYFILNLILAHVNLYLPDSIFNLENSFWCYATDPNSSSSNNIANTLNKGGDAGIMSICLAGGLKLAQKSPTVAGKVGAAVASVGLGAAAIVTKNIVGNVSADLGSQATKKLIMYSFSNLSNFSTFAPFQFSHSHFSSKFWGNGSISNFNLADLFNLTGNNITDLLKMIQYFLNTQKLLLILILYFLVLLNINASKFEIYLKKFLPLIVVNFLTKNLINFKKSGLTIITILCVLSLIATLLGIHYLNFFVVNFDDICEYYINNKTP